MILGLDRHVHAQCFSEINAAVEAMTDRVVCFNAHAFPNDVPEGATIYQTENWPQLTPAMLERWRGHGIFDFHLPNLAHYPITQPVKHVPFGYHPSMERFERAKVLDIDVVFAGAMNARRAAVLDGIRAHGINVVHVPSGMYGAERDALLARAKLALNMQFYPDGAWPALRVAHLVANRVPVLSESHPGCWDFVVQCRYGQLVDAAAAFVRDLDDAARLYDATFAYEAFRRMPMVLPS